MGVLDSDVYSPPFDAPAPAADKPANDDSAATKKAADKTKAIVGERTSQWTQDRASLTGEMKKRMDAAMAIPVPKMPEWSPPPKPQETDPVSVWGSLAMVAAALGGARTRSSATTALNAAASVMNSFKQGDMEKTKEALDVWKEKNAYALKVFDYQLEIYKSLMGAQDKSFSEMMQLSREDRMERAADMAAASAALRDEHMRQLIERGQFEDADKLLQGQIKSFEELEKASAGAEAAATFQIKTMELQKTKAFRDASQDEKLNMIYKLMHDEAPELDRRGTGTKPDMDAAEKYWNWKYVDPVTKQPKPDAPKDQQEWYKEQWPHEVGPTSDQYKVNDKITVTDENGKKVVKTMTKPGNWANPDNWEAKPEDNPDTQPAPGLLQKMWNAL